MTTQPSALFSTTWFDGKPVADEHVHLRRQRGRVRASIRSARLMRACPEIAYQRDAFGERRGGALDADAIGSGESDAAIPLQEQDQLAGIEWRLLARTAASCDRARVDLDDAERPGGEAQAVALDQRLRRLGRQAEAVDELLVQRVELVGGLGSSRAACRATRRSCTSLQ